MKHAIKKNLLIILLIFFGYTAYALANTYSRPNGTTQYVGGAKAVGPAIDTDFNSVVTWLNGGNIGSTNVSALGIAQSNIALNAVGPSQLSVGVQGVTSSSSIALIQSVTPLQVGTLSTTMTVSGVRPVLVRLEPNPGSYLLGGASVFHSYLKFTTTDAGSANIFIIKDSATTAVHTLESINSYGPCSSLSYIDQPSAGSHTWAVMGSTSNASNDALTVLNCRLTVEEL